LQLVKTVGIRFLLFSGPRIDLRVSGWILRLEIVLLLRQRKNPTDGALYVLEGVPAQTQLLNQLDFNIAAKPYDDIAATKQLEELNKATSAYDSFLVTVPVKNGNDCRAPIMLVK
jgi:hypothetical protein